MSGPQHNRPIGFFVHHQGRGHIRRAEAILAHLGDRPITIMTADPDAISTIADDRVQIIALPNAIGDPSLSPALHDQTTPDVFHCVPLGSERLRENAGLIARFFADANPSLFFVDVSAEWVLYARLASVPAVKVRMHGARDDPGHAGAYQAAVAMVAPFHEDLEQADYPKWARAKTFYSGGLCTTTKPVRSKEAARARLGLDLTQPVVVAMAGGGGAGTPLAPLTMAARAWPEAHWFTIGPVSREGHETEFANLTELGWVDDPLLWLAAADVVIASAGDNTVHEIARVGRPFLCIPEWRYFDEQVAKARELDRLGAAHANLTWPASPMQWRDAIGHARGIDLDQQRRLFDPDAAAAIASFLERLEQRLWSTPQSATPSVSRAEPTPAALAQPT
ncbi:MAG: glycosyltransferase [Pseudomonadota bacterium]